MAARRNNDLEDPTVSQPTGPDAPVARPWYGSGYSTAPEESAGILGAIGGAISDAAGAVGGAVSDAAQAVGNAVETVARPVVNAAGAAAGVVLDNPVVQIALAAGTGGLSLAVQAGVEAATGGEGRVLGFFEDVAENPVGVLTSVPGVLLTETGLPGLVFEAASAAGAGAQAAFGEDSQVGQIGGAINSGVEDLQQAAREDPVASLQVAAGVAAAAFGVPIGPALIAAGVKDLLGGAIAIGNPQPEAPANSGIVPPHAASPAVAPSSLTPLPSSGGRPGWKLLAGGAAAAGLVALLALLPQSASAAPSST